MRVLIADDHPLVHEVLASLLATIDEKVEIQRAESYVELLGILSGDRGFDLLISDLYMPGMDVLPGLNMVRQVAPEIPTVIFSAEESPAIIKRVLSCGVAGYLLKTEHPGNILRDLQKPFF